MEGVPRSRWPRVAAGLDASIGALLVLVTLRSSHDSAAAIAGSIGVATVCVRRRWPAAACVVLLAGLSVNEQLAGESLAVAPVAIALDYYTLGRSGGSRRRLVDIVLVVVPLVLIAAGPNGSGFVNLVTPWLFFGVVPFGAGRLIARHETLTRRLHARVEELEREQRESERREAAIEHGRIARELHDVVGHNLSVMVIQAVAARRVAAADRTRARVALGLVAETGREALVEIRRLTGVVHHDGGGSDAGSAPVGLAHLPVLVERTSAVGVPVRLTFDGDPYRLPPGLDLAAFRVVQEALTNVIKHAGRASADVRVAYGAEAVEIEISDDGDGDGVAHRGEPSGSQLGLLGMRERVSLYGGELLAGTRPEGGFAVSARLPLSEGAGV